MPFSVDGIKLNVSRFREFGAYIIHYYSLTDGYLFVKFKSNTNIKGEFYNRIPISERMQLVLINLLDTKEIDYNNLKLCSLKERELFDRLMSKSRLKQELKFDKRKTELDEGDLVDKFNVLQGQIVSGNNNADLLDECKDIIPKLVAFGKISQAQAQDILQEFNNI